MSFSYTLRESFAGFRRTRLSSLLAVVTLWIALILLGMFAVVSVNVERFTEALRDRVEMEAFVREPASAGELARMEETIRALPGVAGVTFVSKEEAARIFQQEFGEDIHRVLDFNPLPPSFKIALTGPYRTADSARALHGALSAVAGIDTVVYRRTLLELIDARTAALRRITLALGVFVALSAVVLVANTVRLAIHARRHTLRTMELVGATRSFIRLPFLIEGMLQGLLGGLLASLLLAVVVERLVGLVSPELAQFLHMPPLFYAGVAAAGVLLGLTGSMVSVTRFLPAA